MLFHCLLGMITSLIYILHWFTPDPLFNNGPYLGIPNGISLAKPKEKYYLNKMCRSHYLIM